ncbi:hypothetical protein [Silvibacterium dinghuense]|uniref:Uncharacterized protein n=1 Tax=Silvibacterium dinghuense TaxID=1560006 RepID=A0A4Q1S9F1_9BACT|nr:hypothetical protein [Silvibacterium dinghuense]RXS93683.1 hypothetical protein ESZ00_16600 [Silvibacterium dinghuense]
MAQDPWEDAAAQYKASQAKGSASPSTVSSNDDWKLWQAGTGDAQHQGVWDTIKSGASNLAKGAAKGIAGDVSNIDNAVAKIPGIGNWLTTPLVGGHSSQQARAQLSAASTPHGTMQGIGRGIEQAGEFLIPGLGEEEAAGRIASLIPSAGRAAAPLARVGYNALTSGAINAMQGGGFASGALAGAGGGAIGEGMRAVAPALAESAIGIRKTDRAYGRTPGRMILDETKGYSPRAVANSAQATLNQLNPQLDRIADVASVRPRPAISGLLQEPVLDEFGRVTQPHPIAGVIPTTEPNRIGSLIPARGIVGSAIGRATAQNAEKEAGQLQPMSKFLSQRFNTGELIPEQVTPRELLNLRRGFGNEFVHNWNPEVSPSVTGTARRAYGALTDEFHRAVPEAADLDRRIGGLIPVAKRAESADLNAPFTQRVAGRLKAHTGALIGSVGGSLYGYGNGGGIPGAVRGAAISLLAPAVLASPRTLMTAARVANAPGALLRAAQGGALQLAREKAKKGSATDNQ